MMVEIVRVFSGPVSSFFFLNDPAPPDISPLPHPAALPSGGRRPPLHPPSLPPLGQERGGIRVAPRSDAARTHAARVGAVGGELQADRIERAQPVVPLLV